MTSSTSNVRIVARIRPLLPHEHPNDIVVTSEGTSVKVPNPKNEKEIFTFQFNALYPSDSDQAVIFTEVSPTLKHLFKGNDVTIFAHGVTGSGKTYTMKGNNKPAIDRGIIPRLLTAIYRRGKEIEKKSPDSKVIAVMSYYEIYNDRVFDLFEAPEKRTLAGLPLREANGKTHVVGLSEVEITTLKEFETLYDTANKNRSTSATKLNASSSRSHAVMCVRVRIEDGKTGEVKTGTVSCIDLAGSEDNRRTANDKERMVESASINKSLFVLAQCVEAMTKKQNRIPYRESKMTRILSLGQNNGMTVMILNLAPTKQYHQDTLQALNFANRTKKIEVKNTEKETVFMPPTLSTNRATNVSGAPIRAFGTVKSASTHNTAISNVASKSKISAATSSATNRVNKPISSLNKSDRMPPPSKPIRPRSSGIKKAPGPSSSSTSNRNTNSHHRAIHHHHPAKENCIDIENIVEKKIEEYLASKALNESTFSAPPPSSRNVSDEVNRRLELLEQKIEKKADARAEGLTYILLGKQHQARGEIVAAIKMFQLAQEYFPENEKLKRKIEGLVVKRKSEGSMGEAVKAVFSSHNSSGGGFGGLDFGSGMNAEKQQSKPKRTFAVFTDLEGDQESTRSGSPARKRAMSAGSLEQSPRTRQLLRIINSEDVEQIMKLKGIGKKRAEALAMHVRDLRERNGDDDWPAIKDLQELGLIKGIGNGMVESMKSRIAAKY